MSPPAHVQAATLQTYIEEWSAWTPKFLDVWTEDCAFRVLPSGLGRPSRTRAQIGPLYVRLMETLKNFQLTVHNIVHDPVRATACIYVKVKADTDFGPYENEQAVFIEFDESGEKVRKIEEMNDALAREEFDRKYHDFHGVGKPPANK